LQKAVVRLSPGLDETNAVLCIQSFVAQLVHTVFAKSMLSRANKSLMPLLEHETAISHIVSFSVAGIEAKMKGKG